MNPINDEMSSKDSTDVQESCENLKETKLEEDDLKEQKDNEEKLKENLNETSADKDSNEQKINEQLKEITNEKDLSQEQNENYEELEEKKLEDSKEEDTIVSEIKIETENEKIQEPTELETKMLNKNFDESEVNEKDVDGEEEMNTKIGENLEIDLEPDAFEEDVNKESSVVSEPATEDEAEEYEDFEDVEIPGEDDVDEIIVPDEAEAEDLTDDKDRNEEMEEKSLNGDQVDEEDAEQSINESDVEEKEAEDLTDEKDRNKEMEEKFLNGDEAEGEGEEQSMNESDVEEKEAEDLTDDKEMEEKSLNGDEVDAEGEEQSMNESDVEEKEAEDLTDDKDRNEEMEEKSLNGDVVEDEEQSMKESDVEENEEEAATIKSSEMQERYEKGERDNAQSDKKSENNKTKEDTTSKDSENEAELVALEDEITNAESPMEQPKLNQTNLDEDTTTQASFYDPLNCTAEAKDDDDEAENEESVKNVESENSNDESQNEEGKNIERKENIESANENSVESSQSLRKNDDNEQNEEDDDEVQFVETRNSPICIESDDDDLSVKDKTKTTLSAINTNNNNNKSEINRKVITTATTTVTVPKNLTVTRTSARKSTAKPPQNQVKPTSHSPASAAVAGAYVPLIQNKTKNFNYLYKSSTFNKRFIGASAQKIVDCIELLDSSDEESSRIVQPLRQTAAQLQRTPQKRTLLAAKGNYYKNNNNNNNKPANRLPHNFTPQIRQQPKKPAPLPLPPATPQSNFLNAVQLQPAAMTGPNPPAFSALLSNKNVIIPNAFYGNPPSVRGASNDTELEKRSTRWLENFLNQFCKPQFEPTHSCFVFLQRALKYKDFVRIKALRTSMNSHAQNATNQLNIQLMTDLKTIFFKNINKTTNYGQRFCELTCSAVPGKAVSLITHRLSGKITLSTCYLELPKTTNSTTASNASISASAGGSGANASLTGARKRQLDEDEDEYTPDKSVYKTKGKPPSENDDEDSGDTTVGDDRKRSLRTKRTKRIDNSFSYNEDDLLAEYEIDDVDDEKLVQVEIQRKIEQKRLEAQQQRQQQAKSFESAFIQAFAKSIDAPTTSTKTKNSAANQRIRLKNTTSATVTSIKQYTANNDAEDLLQATWIENLENDNAQIISDDDEPQEHRIYKQQQEQLKKQIQQKLQQQKHQGYYKLPNNLIISKVNSAAHSPKNSGRATKRTAATTNQIQEEFITGDDYEENNHYNNNATNVEPFYWPKNIDSQMTVSGKNKDRCVICNLNCQRLVHHYVNEHRGCETYNSRLSATQIKKLKQGNCTASVSLYKNGQNLYEAFCIFCNKVSRFMLRYWYQHYTMHTGEYAYRCTGCGVRKPTQSLLTLHYSQGCTEEGGRIMQDYTYDAKSMQIEAKICTICNYVQLYRSNIVKHLHTQHNIKQILPKHILTVVLMKIPPNIALPSGGTLTTTISYTQPQATRRSNRSTRKFSAGYGSAANTFVIEDEHDGGDYEVNEYEEILPDETSQLTQQTPPPANHYYNYIPPYMQAALNAGNLSFENVEAGDDLSFMICGMLDVQTNTNDTD